MARHTNAYHPRRERRKLGISARQQKKLARARRRAAQKG